MSVWIEKSQLREVCCTLKLKKQGSQSYYIYCLSQYTFIARGCSIKRANLTKSEMILWGFLQAFGWEYYSTLSTRHIFKFNTIVAVVSFYFCKFDFCITQSVFRTCSGFTGINGLIKCWQDISRFSRPSLTSSRKALPGT